MKSGEQFEQMCKRALNKLRPCGGAPTRYEKDTKKRLANDNLSKIILHLENDIKAHTSIEGEFLPVFYMSRCFCFGSIYAADPF